MHHGCSWVIVMHVALVGGKVMVGLEVVFGCKNGAEVVMEVVFVAVEVGCDGHGDLGQRWSWKCAWERKKKKDKKGILGILGAHQATIRMI